MIISSWLLMQVCHESGHAAVALLTGGTVQRIVLVPWELSRTDIGNNPYPLMVCWAGPVVGVVLPTVVWLLLEAFRSTFRHWMRFFAGFCLIANGAYIGVGSFTHDGDGGDLIRHGSSIGTMWVFFAMTVPLGLFLWHGTGKHFGFGPNASSVTAKSAIFGLITTIAIITIEIVAARL
jgi:hypothetical protein